jgi:hypothetical protein
MPVEKGKGQMKDSGFSRPYGPFSAKEAKKIADAIEKGSTKKPAPKKPMAPRTPSTGTKKVMPKVEGTKPGIKKPMPKVAGAKPGTRTLMSKTTTKAPAKMTPKPKVTKKPEKMTPQDAAMKKILEKKYGKIYG